MSLSTLIQGRRGKGVAPATEEANKVVIEVTQTAVKEEQTRSVKCCLVLVLSFFSCFNRRKQHLNLHLHLQTAAATETQPPFGILAQSGRRKMRSSQGFTVLFAIFSCDLWRISVSPAQQLEQDDLKTGVFFGVLAQISV